MAAVTIAVTLPSLLDALKVAGPTVAVLIGFVMLPRQEQKKRQEEGRPELSPRSSLRPGLAVTPTLEGVCKPGGLASQANPGYT